MPASRGRGILNFGFLSDPFSLSTGRIPPSIPPDIVKGKVYTRTSIMNFAHSRGSILEEVVVRSSIKDLVLTRESTQTSVVTRESIREKLYTKTSGKKEQEL